MIKVISFDIGGTLLKRDHSKPNNYSLQKLSELVELPYEIVRNAYKEIFQKKKGTLEELQNDFCKLLQIKPSSELNEFFINKFNNQEEEIQKEDIELLKELKKQGYKVILFSNNCCLIKTNIVEKTKGIVDEVFYSYDLGYNKNDNESYHLVEEKLGYKASEFLHIGDTLKSDYLKPIENGWNALFYGESTNEDVKSITNLKDLLKYLEDMNKTIVQKR